MTVHVVLADPPREGLALPGLVASSPLDADGAANLYAAALKDTFLAAARSGGDLLVNYPDTEHLPESHRGGESPEAELRALAADALDDPDEARFEVQVGSTKAARAGNAATHLLEEEDADSVAILDGTVPLFDRTDFDGAAMQLRRNELVVGPGPGGRLAYLGLTAPIDFEGALSPPEVETVVGRGVEAGHDVAFLSAQPTVDREGGLASAVATIRARAEAGRRVPAFTAGVIDDLGLRVVERDGARTVRVDGS